MNSFSRPGMISNTATSSTMRAAYDRTRSETVREGEARGHLRVLALRPEPDHDLVMGLELHCRRVAGHELAVAVDPDILVRGRRHRTRLDGREPLTPFGEELAQSERDVGRRLDVHEAFSLGGVWGV